MTDIGHNSASVGMILLEEPQALFRETDMLTQLVEQLSGEIEECEIDLTTAKGRAVITKLASRITTFKTTIDKAGKKLNEDHRLEINKVDTIRRDARERLDALKAKARKPLTDWENAEEARQNTINTIDARIMELSEVPMGATSAQIGDRLGDLEGIALDPDTFVDRLNEFVEKIRSTKTLLIRLKDNAQKQEADAAELERLRRERAEQERLQQEAEAKAEAERLEAERAEREKAELEAAKAKAADEAAAEAKRKAEQEAQAKIDEERKQREAAEAELKRQEAERKRIAAEKAQREADEANRAAVHRNIERGLIEQSSISGETAQLITLAIAAGSIPNVSIAY